MSREILTDAQIAEILLKWNLQPYEWIKVLSLYTTEARLRTLVNTLRAKGVAMLGTKIEIDGQTVIDSSHKNIATVLGCSREKATRALVKLAREGVVGSGYGKKRALQILGAA